MTERPKKTIAMLGASGRVGSSISLWLEALGHRVVRLSRTEFAAGGGRGGADVFALATPDGALEPLASLLRREGFAGAVVHFSGARLVPGAFGFHPLYSFPKTPLSPAETARIAFARQAGAPPLPEIFPGADNPEFVVDDRDRAFYHALAVVSGNFATFLWNAAAKEGAARLALDPARHLAPYFKSLIDRFVESPFYSLTGPVARREAATVQANLDALAAAPELRAAYLAFLARAWPEFGRDEEQ